MRFSQLPFSVASVAATAIVAATLGVMTVALPSGDAVSLASFPVFVEEITVEASPLPDSAVSVSVRAQRPEYLTGETVVLEATLRNDGELPVAIEAAGVYDLAVQRASSPQPMGVGDIMFLALAESGPEHAVLLAPGEELTRLVTVGSDAPFDRPGRYRVNGSWLGADMPADVDTFEVRISDSEALVTRTVVATNPGA